MQAAESGLQEKEQSANAQTSRITQERATLDSAQYDLSKVHIESPIDGIVTKRNIQEGEMVMIGTMNNAGTVLLTLADMSDIQAEVEVDETNMPHVTIGQKAKITIDAIPDKTFKGHVTEIGNSPMQTTTPRHDRHAGDELQGRRDARRRHAGGAARASRARPTSRPPTRSGGHVGADSGGRRARAGRTTPTGRS